MTEKWKIFCEESGCKSLNIAKGATHFYIVTAILVREEFESALINSINAHKVGVLRMRRPLEWKRLDQNTKRNDKVLSRFLSKIRQDAPFLIISAVVCNKSETNGVALRRPNYLMNYLYGLMFKRISCFLSKTNAVAELIIDRNTDTNAQDSLKRYISDISKIQTGQYPRHSKPHWTNPENHPILGMSDFLGGLMLRSLTEYKINALPICTRCRNKIDNCIYNCVDVNYRYKRSLSKIVDLNYMELENWSWKGLLYHPNEYKNDHRIIFQPK